MTTSPIRGESLGGATLDLKASLKDLNDNLGRAEQKVRGSVDRMQGAANKLAIGASAVAAAIGAVGFKAVGAAVDFERGMREVNTLVGGDENAFQQLQTDMLQFSRDVGIATDTAIPGLYQAISSGVPPDNVFEFMRASADAAIGGNAELADVIGVTTATLKAYGLEMEEAARIQDVLQKTVNLGVTTLPELGANIGKATPLAAALGVTVEELAAGFATLTGVTGNTAEVSTQLRATFQALLAPPTDMADALAELANRLSTQGKLVEGPLLTSWEKARNELGKAQQNVTDLRKEQEKLNVTTADDRRRFSELGQQVRKAESHIGKLNTEFVDASAALGPTIVRSVGFGSALELLGQISGGNSATLQKMFGSVEAVGAVLSLSGPQVDVYGEKLGEVNNATGTVQAALDEVNKGLGRQWDILKNQLNVELTKLGLEILPHLTEFMENTGGPAIDNLTEKMGNNADKVLIAGGAILGLAILTLTATLAIKAFGVWVAIATGIMTIYNLLATTMIGRTILVGLAMYATSLVAIGRFVVGMVVAGVAMIATAAIATGRFVVGMVVAGVAMIATAAIATGRFVVGMVVAGVAMIATAAIATGRFVVAMAIAGGAMLAAIGPIGWIILGVLALIAVGVLLWKNWDAIKAKAKEIWGKVPAIIREPLEKAAGFVMAHWDKILAILFPPIGLPILIFRNWDAIKDKVKEVFDNVWPVIKRWFWDTVDFFKELPGEIVKALKNLPSMVGDVLNRIPGVGAIGGAVGGIVGGIRTATGFQHGGIAMQPTFGLVGEVEPEAVIPLSQLDRFAGGGRGPTYNFYGDIYGFDDFVEKVQEAQLLGDRRGREDLLR